MKRHIIVGIHLLIGISSFLPISVCAESSETMAKQLTTYFRAARKVISDNQKHINDASKGDKGLSGSVVVTQAKSNYQTAAGSALPENDATAAMSMAIEQVMSQAQVLINEKDKGFKGFLPAVFAKQVADQFSKKMVGKMFIKLTAPKVYVRNRSNRPDSWESNVIEKHFKSDGWEKGKAFAEVSTHKGKNGFRYILPEYYGQSCLGCHGEPKGAVDITGGKKEGGKLGELGGAISFVHYE